MPIARLLPLRVRDSHTTWPRFRGAGHGFRLTKGEIVWIGKVKLTLVDVNWSRQVIRLGIEAPKGMRVDRNEIFGDPRGNTDSANPTSAVITQDDNSLEAQVDRTNSAVPLISVSFCEGDFTAEDIELVLKYLSAVYREAGGTGLKVVSERGMIPQHEGVVI